MKATILSFTVGIIATAPVKNEESLLPGTLHQLHTQDGEIRTGEVIGQKEDWVRVRLSERGRPAEPIITILLKRASLQKVVPLEWDFWEAEPIKETQKALEQGWNAMNCLLGVPGARVGTLGNAWANHLITQWETGGRNQNASASGLLDTTILDTAQKLYSMIENNSTDTKERITARAGRLYVVRLQGKNRQALEEAEAWTRATTDAPPEAWDALGESLLAAVEALAQEHPRWEQDPFVKPKIIGLFHDCLDASLIAFARYPTNKNMAARGLIRSRRIYELSKNSKSVEQANSDLNTFYQKEQKK